MDHVVLGRTGLEVSVAGLGCGGSSRLGQGRDASAEESIQLVHDAFDLGITYFDTAEGYGTEEIVGRALAEHRDEVVISTKSMIHRPGAPRADAAALRRAVESSLARLGTDTIDVYHLHGVVPGDYGYCVAELLPELYALRDNGAIRYLALSEAFPDDLGHEMLLSAAIDGYWDVLMVGFNVLNPSARRRLLPTTIASEIGIEVMYVVRNALSRPEVLRASIADVVSRGLLDEDGLDRDDPLGFLVHASGAHSLVDAAYRFARHEPGCHVVLTGTGSGAHLRSNVESINAPPLPAGDLERLEAVFGDLVAFAGN